MGDVPHDAHDVLSPSAACPFAVAVSAANGVQATRQHTGNGDTGRWGKFAGARKHNRQWKAPLPSKSDIAGAQPPSSHRRTLQRPPGSHRHRSRCRRKESPGAEAEGSHAMLKSWTGASEKSNALCECGCKRRPPTDASTMMETGIGMNATHGARAIAAKNRTILPRRGMLPHAHKLRQNGAWIRWQVAVVLTPAVARGPHVRNFGWWEQISTL